MNTERSQFPSIKLDQLVYVELESGNGGMMLTVSEEGFTFRAVTPVRPNGTIPFSFTINGSEKLEGHGNIEWTEDDGKVAGLQFTEVTPQFQNALRTWLSQLSAPAVPSFSPVQSEDFSLNSPSSFEATVPELPPAASPARVQPRAELPSIFSPPSLNLAGSNGNLPPSSPAHSPMGYAGSAQPMLSAWDYPKELPARSRINPLAAVAAAILFVALAVLVYGYHQALGESLILLGQKLSSAPETSPSQPTKAPEVSKPQAEQPQAEQPQALSSVNTATAQPTPVPQPVTDSRNKMENAPAAVKTTTTAPAQNPPPASERWVDQPRNQAPADQARSLWSAVAQGNTSAEVALAKLYLIGGGVTKNCDQARVLLQAAAKKGNGEAVDKLSQLENQGCP